MYVCMYASDMCATVSKCVICEWSAMMIVPRELAHAKLPYYVLVNGERGSRRGKGKA